MPIMDRISFYFTAQSIVQLGSVGGLLVTLSPIGNCDGDQRVGRRAFGQASRGYHSARPSKLIEVHEPISSLCSEKGLWGKLLRCPIPTKILANKV